MHALLHDLRFAARLMLKNPGFTAIVVLTLALGIGANSAIFSVVNAVVLRPLPYRDPARLVQLYTQFPGMDLNKFWMSAPEYLDVQKEATSFESIGGWVSAGAPLTGGSEPVRIPTAYATSGFFETLGVDPMPGGRFFTPEEDQPNVNRVAVISHGIWQRFFGADANIVGRDVTVDGLPFKIIGVMPKGFDFPGGGIELWVPLGTDRANPGNRGSHGLSVIARLKPGTDIGQARAEMDTLMARWDQQYAGQHRIHGFNPAVPDDPGHPIVIHPLHGEVVGNAQASMLMLLGAVAFVLLIACANVANLLLARAEARQREIAIRTALGASRTSLLRQFLTESILLGVLGGGLGLLLAVWGLDLIVASSPGSVPRVAEIGIDGTVLAFTLAVSLGTGVLFGLAPFFHTRIGGLHAALKSGGARTTASRRQRRFRQGLVVTEMALAVILLVGSGLMLRSFWRLQRVDPGFNPDHVLTFQLELTEVGYKDRPAVLAFWNRLRDQLAATPGVLHASLTSQLPPIARLQANDVRIDGFVPDPKGPIQNIDYWHVVGDDYFPAMGVTLTDPPQGRLFDSTDRQGAQPVALINEATARKFWPSESPIGKRIRTGQEDQWMTIIGVVGNLKQQGLDKPAGTDLFLPLQQVNEVSGYVPRLMTVVLKTGPTPESMFAPVRSVVASLDPMMPVANLRTLESLIHDAMARPRFLALLLTIFSAVALALAAVGIYGVMSYSVAQRTNEIGIRMALGASTGNVLRLVLLSGLGLAVLGIGLGLLGTAAVTRLSARALESVLFEVRALDPATLSGVTLVLLAVSLLASYLPARRATRLDPLVALRTE